MKFLVLQHIYDHKPVMVNQGAYLDSNDASHWITVKDTVVPAESIIKAGSMVDMDLTQFRAKRAVKNGVLAPVDNLDGYHFNLESVFGNDMVDHLDGKPALMTEILHEHGIFTLEQIASEKPGIVPFTPQNTEPTPLSLRAILGMLCNNENREINLWIAMAKEQIAKTEAPKVVPQVAASKPAKG